MGRILLIEPDKVLSRSYKKALEQAGHEVHCISNAQDAINNADQTLPDVVILEIQLIAHSGIEFLYEFRSYPEWQKVPVIILSLVPPQEFNNNWQLIKDELNIDTYLYKPATTLNELINEVSKILK